MSYDHTSMIALEITDNNGDTLASWTRENIRETIYYALPCDENNDTIINITYTPSPDVAADEHYVIIKDYITPIGDREFSVNVGRYGSKLVTIVLDDGEVHNEYTVVLERRVPLFDVITEHLGGIRLVHNNPERNITGLKFSTCTWYSKQGADTVWAPVDSNFYYLAGKNIKDKFTINDSMYLILYTTEGVRVVTCPDADSSTYISNPTPGGANFGQKSGEEAVYPNPVSTGGSVHLKPKLLENGEEKRYTHFYLYNIQGTLITSGNAAPLYQGEGLTMPNTPGIYHLILEDESKKKWVRIAVGN
jgi:hypothetical protein